VLDTKTDNPLTAGINITHTPQPCTLVIFGGGGDLTRRKLLPAVYNQALDGELPANFAVLGLAIEDMDDVKYREFARKGVEAFSRQALDVPFWADFEKRLHYLQGSFDNPELYVQLKQRLDELDSKFSIPGNRVFYLAIPPALIETCVCQLKAAGLVMPVGELSAFSRIIVEKPIGRDLESARKVNATLCNNFA
jgi:glucose-6-phosphate 1-dehydrogenase